MNQELYDWLLLILRWVHITTAVAWIGTSIFFMWLDRSFEPDPKNPDTNHLGHLWMVHGGGFYHVQKLKMGSVKVPEHLHWFKWESYWTWISGVTLVALIFYAGDGVYLLDSMISHISFTQGILLGLFSIFGSWFFYDFVWERDWVRKNTLWGHIFTILWLVGMTYLLCKTLSGRAAYIHVGAMIGTWMTANVFLRIIPRQVKMVEAASKGEPVNSLWAVNAKNRSTHNTYFTLPVIFIMLSNHFPTTYGHDYNWLILLALSAGAASIREYFICRIKKPQRSKVFASIGVILILFVIFLTTHMTEDHSTIQPTSLPVQAENINKEINKEIIKESSKTTTSLSGIVTYSGKPWKPKKLHLPPGCTKGTKDGVFANEILIENGRLKNVLVRVTKGLEGRTFTDVPATEVLLDQKHCLYEPRVVAARVGQKVTFVNSDEIFHNVRSVTPVNEKFNVAMPYKDQRITKVFHHPEISLQTKCSVHPWMTAYVAVLDHPYFDVTDGKGEFNLDNIPDGQYTLEAWHEFFGTLTMNIELPLTKPEILKFDYK